MFDPTLEVSSPPPNAQSGFHGLVAYVNHGRAELAGNFIPQGFQQDQGECFVASNAYLTTQPQFTNWVGGGTLSGGGAFRFGSLGSLAVAINPGSSPGLLEVSVQGGASALKPAPETIVNIEVGSSAIGKGYDQLSLLGTPVILDGLLQMKFIGDYVPANGVRFHAVAWNVTAH